MENFSELFVECAIDAVILNDMGPMSNCSRTEIDERVFEIKLVERLRQHFDRVEIQPHYKSIFQTESGLIGDIIIYSDQNPAVFVELKILDEKYRSGQAALRDIDKIRENIGININSDIDCYIGLLVTDLENRRFGERLDYIEKKGNVKFRRGATQKSFNHLWEWSTACAKVS
jgi:hypothetical protein